MISLYIVSIIGIVLFSSLNNAVVANRKYFSKKELTKGERCFFFIHLQRYVFKSVKFYKERHVVILSLLLGKSLFQFVNLFSIFYLCNNDYISLPIWCFLSFLSFFIFSEGIPKFVANYFPNHVLMSTAFLGSCLLIINLPILFPLIYLSSLITLKVNHHHFIRPQITQVKEEILAIVEEIDLNHKLDSAEKKIIESVITFKTRLVKEVMLPRVDIFFLKENTTILEAITILKDEGYSRIPVCKDSIDNVIGVLMYKDLLNIYTEDDRQNFLNKPVKAFTKNVIYTPETKKVSHLLQDFKKKQMHIAIVVDEYGGTSGMITIEDILEEIVGDISDEFDDYEDSLFMQKVNDGWIVDGKMSIIDVEKNCNVIIPQDSDYETIGGYVFKKIGFIPKNGLRLHEDEFELEIVKSNDRAIKRIKISTNGKESQ